MPPRAHAALAAVALSALACNATSATFSFDPIPLQLVGGKGGLISLGTAAERTTPFPMLVDTASPLTAFSDGTRIVRGIRGTLRLFAGGDASVPRLELADIPLFVTALSGSGLDTASPITGVLGGDNLRRFVLGVAYDPTPSIRLFDQLTPTECEISEHCAAVLPFSLVGGRQQIDIADDIFSYPASYVLLDACVEPTVDPLEAGLACADRGCLARCPAMGAAGFNECVARCGMIGYKRGCDRLCGSLESQGCLDCLADADRYLPHGLDVRFAVATGFPGVALTAAAYDRLRGRGAAAALFATAPHTLYLPDQPLEAPGVTVGLDTLGLPLASLHDAVARSSIALVGRTGYFGACAELARSRRLRRVPPERAPTDPADVEVSCLRKPPGSTDPLLADPLLDRCDSENSSGVCEDRSEDAHTTAYVEIVAPIPLIVVPDTTSLLQSINADVRPDSATVEGVIGTELLRRLDLTIDYPRGRVVVTCADASCRLFPALGHGTDCAAPSGDQAFGGRPARTFATPRYGAVGCATP